MAAVTVLIAAGVSLALSSPAGSVAGFGDVPEQSFYTDAVQWMVDNGLYAAKLGWRPRIDGAARVFHVVAQRNRRRSR